MTKPVRLDEEAQQELDAAVAWYDLQTHDLTLGSELLDGVEEAIALIVHQPRLHHLVPEVAPSLGVRRCWLRRFPFSLVYTELEHEIRVLAVAHARRRPGYWRRRL